MQAHKHNILGLFAALVLYVIAGYGLSLLGFKGRDGLIIMVIVHIGFGIAGYFIFTGKLFIRSLLVFSAVFIYGLVIELTNPDPQHAQVQLFVSIPLGILAAGAVPVGRFLEQFWITRRA